MSSNSYVTVGRDPWLSVILHYTNIVHRLPLYSFVFILILFIAEKLAELMSTFVDFLMRCVSYFEELEKINECESSASSK